MSFDIGFKKFDLIALKFNDVLDQITNRNNANYFVFFNYWQVPDVLVNHDRHALIQRVRECHSKRVRCHDF